ncbi:MAG: DUF1833 family protein [Candidimonas sp.]
MTTLLNIVYASAPTGELIIPSLEILIPGTDPIRVCNGFEDQWLGVAGQYFLFEATPLAVALPSKNTSGQQTLSFGIPGVSGRAERQVDHALETGAQVKLIYREYLESDKSAPARRPYVMTMAGGVFEGPEVSFEASYYDLLNTAWPRERYTAESAPGIKYL